MPIYIETDAFGLHPVDKTHISCTTPPDPCLPLIDCDPVCTGGDPVTTATYSSLKVEYSGVTNPGSVYTKAYAVNSSNVRTGWSG